MILSWTWRDKQHSKNATLFSIFFQEKQVLNVDFWQHVCCRFQNRRLHLCLRVNKGQRKWITWIEPEEKCEGVRKIYNAEIFLSHSVRRVSKSGSIQRVNTLVWSEKQPCIELPSKTKAQYACPNVVSKIAVIHISHLYTRPSQRFE